jgi:glucokinase
VREDPLLGHALISLAGTIDQIEARVLGDTLHSGDPLARRLIDATSQYLAAGI